MPECWKTPYLTMNEAHAAVAALVRQGRGKTRIYHCPICKHYHLTSTNQSTDPAKRKRTRL